MTLHILALLTLALVTLSVSASFINRTIDDAFGDQVTGVQIVYSGDWGHSRNNNPTQFQNGTFSQGSSSPVIGEDPAMFSFSFRGVAIYIVGMLPGAGSLTNISVTIDGKVAGGFRLQQGELDPAVFNVTFFAQDSLPYGRHDVSIQTVDPESSVVNFDYALYTTNTTASDIVDGTAGAQTLSAQTSSTPSATPSKSLSSTPSASPTNSPSPPTHSSSTAGNPGVTTDPLQSNPTPQRHKFPTAAVVGGSVGGGLALLFLLGLLLCQRRRSRELHSPAKDDFTPKPFSVSPRSLPAARSDEKALPVPPDSDVIVIEASEDDTSAILLREQLQFFRSELQALRARRPSMRSKIPLGEEILPPLPSDNGAAATVAIAQFSAGPSLAYDIFQLRAEIAEWRAQQQNIVVPVHPLNPASDDLQRDINLLRSELEELRMQQIDDPLPEYTPPPPA